eukprot:5732350-Amphidinium_carterae.1
MSASGGKKGGGGQPGGAPEREIMTSPTGAPADPRAGAEHSEGECHRLREVFPLPVPTVREIQRKIYGVERSA